MRPRIFISYRRDDAPGDARSIHDRLAAKFGRSNVFMDVDSLLAGQRFDRRLDEALARCDVLIAIIGHRWADLLVEKIRNSERDYVRDEVAAALKRNIVVIPVLVGQQGRVPPLPRGHDLPENVRDLVLYQKQNVRHESFGRDVDDLIAAINATSRDRPWALPWRSLASAGAVGLLAITALLSYRADIPSSSDVITDCDRLAASPSDTSRPKGVTPVEFSRIDTSAATAACDDALRRYPGIPRFFFQAGRVADARNDHERAMQLYQAAAGMGSAVAMYNLGNLYQTGRGFVKDYDKALSLYKTAAELGNAAAMTSLGRLFHEGDVVSRDYAAARGLYEKAAELGNSFAMTGLGNLYENGQGVPRDYLQARRWYEKAAALGNADAAAYLGLIFEKGRGVSEDAKQAKEWYEQARRWYQKAAELGDAGAMNGLGILYRDSQGVAQDYAEAHKWFEMAAKLGDAGAMTNLGALYQNKQGVRQDYAEARRWYEKAADLGDPDAMFNLGVVYEKGLGISSDIEKARKWYRAAGDAASGKAKAKLADLKK
jgi:TPR repeat protein